MITRVTQDLLSRTLKRFGISEQVQAAQVLEEFQKQAINLLGNGVKNKIKPLYLKNKTIHVSVVSTVLATEIRLYQKRILEAINKKYKKTVVKKIQFLT